jgi:phosphoribosyl-ATP pyrophosphohydrolase
MVRCGLRCIVNFVGKLMLLDDLYSVIASRKGSNPEDSYTASLFEKGLAKIAQKVGEEAVETVIDGVSGPRERVISESADLLYHLLVLWAARDVKPEEVWDELAKRAK